MMQMEKKRETWILPPEVKRSDGYRVHVKGYVFPCVGRSPCLTQVIGSSLLIRHLAVGERFYSTDVDSFSNLISCVLTVLRYFWCLVKCSRFRMMLCCSLVCCLRSHSVSAWSEVHEVCWQICKHTLCVPEDCILQLSWKINYFCRCIVMVWYVTWGCCLGLPSVYFCNRCWGAAVSCGWVQVMQRFTASCRSPSSREGWTHLVPGASR